MGAGTILDELKPLVNSLNVVAGGVDATFEWVEWEEQEEKGGNHVTARSDFELQVSDIGGGAQSSTERVELRFVYENQGRAAEWTVWKNAFIVRVLGIIRGDETAFTGGYFVEVQGIEMDRFRLNPQSRGVAVYANEIEFAVIARRHDVYA